MQPPPAIRDFAIGNETAMQNVVVLQSFGKITFEIEWILRGQQPSSGLNPGGKGSINLIKFAGFRVDVVLYVICVQFFFTQEMIKVNVPPCLGVTGLVVVIHLVGGQLHAFGFNDDAAAQVAEWTGGLLGHGANPHKFRPHSGIIWTRLGQGSVDVRTLGICSLGALI